MLSKLRALITLLIFSFALPVFAESAPGIGNFFKVDDHVYRGAQPSTAGFRYLADIGVKTIIDLREADSRSRAEDKLVTAAGLKYVNVPMTGLTPPTQDQIEKIMAILADPTSGPVFVHCMRGADRTGAVIASYRIQHDGWDNARALKEAMDRGMSFFQLPRQHFVQTFQAKKSAPTELAAAQ